MSVRLNLVFLKTLTRFPRFHYKLPRILCVYISNSNNLCFKNYRSQIKFSKPSKSLQTIVSETENTPDIDTGDELDDLIDRTIRLPTYGHQVFLIQPVIKWGREKKRNTTPELQLLESVTLIKTLRNWKVVDNTIITLDSFSKRTFFGKGNLELMKSKIESNNKITAVFISVNMLSLNQQIALQQEFKVPVFDRFTIVIHIFREHAVSKEAKLQIQLAELPYLKTVLGGMNEGLGEVFGGGGRLIGGNQPRFLSYRKELFRAREAKIKRQILELREQRIELRTKRKKHDMPVVAVVGYTNAGKTSLIKALTGKESLEPQDYLFATLDVTCHAGELPTSLKVYYVDTVGFISDIPTYLIESFISTLEDALVADLIIHVRDISHPDTIAQNEIVLQTLEKLNISETTKKNIITVGNKIDLVNDVSSDGKMILVSSTKLIGIDVLKYEIEKMVLQLTDKEEMYIRVESGGEEYSWLHTYSTVVNETPDEKNTQYIVLKTIISPHVLEKFKAKFIRNYNKR